MQVKSIKKIVTNDKVCVHVEATFSFPQMHVVANKEKMKLEIQKMETWAAAQQLEGMDLHVSNMGGQTALLLCDVDGWSHHGRRCRQ